ncbi:MgtC/SapB family protein [Oligella sp. MSHR50489EDL]|uniref:MgtC/SapB family protein n=1 Tax=Oligella sp. MSHR50489EDL TaxID=3139409 RepID=UPI003D814AB9
MTVHVSSLEQMWVLFLNFLAAFMLGALIGFERQVRQRTAGLRTNTLVALGACFFVSLGVRLFDLMGGPQTPIHVVAYVVSGIGFLGAGAIMKEGANISGLNTAATLWGSGAVGAYCGAGFLGEAILAALFVLASNTLLRPIVNQINRRPFSEESSEATYIIHVICSRDIQADIREQLVAMLEQATYPARQVEDHVFGESDIEIEFTLYATAVQPDELNALVNRIEKVRGVQQAFWHIQDEN